MPPKFKIKIPKSQIILCIPNAQIPNYLCIPNYLWHPKLLMASQITYGIPNYLWHPKLFDIPNYDTLNP